MFYKRICFTHFLIEFLLISLFSGLNFAYNYFQDLVVINIGEWIDLSAQATPEKIEELIENIDTSLVTGCNCEFIGKEYVDTYLEEILFREDVTGETIINPLFEGYTVKEMVGVINNIRRFIANFLVLDDNNKITYPDPSEVSPMELLYDWRLLPGEFYQARFFLVLGNLVGGGSNKPVTIVISMENSNPEKEEDLSDFSAELLIDQTLLDSNNPFPYGMTLRDREAWNDPVIKNNIKNYNQLIPINEVVEYSSYVYRDQGNGNYQLKEYLHQYLRPSFSGDFRRFPEGLNYYLGKLKNSRNGLQQLFEKDNSSRPGLILSGKANGRKVEARVDIDDIKGKGELVIIPFVISLSRGIEVGTANQKTNVIAPKIKLVVINGLVHQEYNYEGTGYSC